MGRGTGFSSPVNAETFGCYGICVGMQRSDCSCVATLFPW